MGESDSVLLESEVNSLISKKMKTLGMIVMQELRLPPCELDVVLFDPQTLQLATLEIKRTNWRALLHQAIRAKLYSHFSIAVMPLSMSSSVPIEEFATRGIGVLFYEENNRSIDLTIAAKPKISNVINRFLKQQLYRQFYIEHGEMIYA